MTDSPNLKQVRAWLQNLQTTIVDRLSAIDGKKFQRDEWQRERGGGGVSQVIEQGQVFERGGVMFSHVYGDGLPASATASRPEIAGKSFEAMGVSLVLHPRNPYVPTVHMNVRFFITTAKDQGDPIWWFGGGIDLTPYYPYEKDVVRFHSVCKGALDPFGEQYHPRFKTWCDDYFFNKHRNEARGVGGVFFDDFNELGFSRSFELTQGVGDSFLDAYVPIVERHKDHIFTERQRDFQLYRRGRYVEFNLVYDRGTHFGLQSGGRAESILVSMPPLASWKYDWTPEAHSPEAQLTEHFLIPRDWV